MRVILKKNSDLGPANSVISVRRGHGRNVLIRNGDAELATAENLHYAALREQRELELTQQQQLQQQQQEEADKQAQVALNPGKGAFTGTSAAAAAAASQAASDAQQQAAAEQQQKASDAATAAASVVASSSSYLTQALQGSPVYVAAVARRLRSQQALVFTLAAELSGRSETDRLQKPLVARDVYLKLVNSYPLLSLRQVSFAVPRGAPEGSAAPDSLATFGAHEVELRLPGQQEPVTIKVQIKKKRGAHLPPEPKAIRTGRKK